MAAMGELFAVCERTSADYRSTGNPMSLLSMPSSRGNLKGLSQPFLEQIKDTLFGSMPVITQAFKNHIRR